jgi:thymidylate kinase
MKTFDFNSITQHTLETKLPGLTLHVTTPPERLIEQLAASQEELNKLETEGASTAEKSRAAYKLAAEIISCNIENVTVTADDLRDKYNVVPVVLAAYLAAYMDFINEFHNAKN